MSSLSRVEVESVIRGLDLWNKRRKVVPQIWYGFSLSEDEPPAIEIFVNTKDAKNEVAEIVAAITAKGLPTPEIRRTGPIRHSSGTPVAPAPAPNLIPNPTNMVPSNSVTPVSPGVLVFSSISNCSGTITGFLRPQKQLDPRVWLLTGCHVLVGTDSLASPQTCSVSSPNGAPISHRVEFSQLDPNNPNTVDAAIALLDNPSTAQAVYPKNLGLSNNSQPSPLLADLQVSKFGAETNITHGIVHSAKHVMDIFDCNNVAHEFVDQMKIELDTSQPPPDPTKPFFACKGDSGALVVSQGNPCGLLIAKFSSIDTQGSCSTSALATPIQIVLDTLEEIAGVPLEFVFSETAV